MQFLNTAKLSTLERVPPAKIAGGGGGCLISQQDIAAAIFEENRRCLIADFYKHLAKDYSAQARANGLLAKKARARIQSRARSG
mgnify:CR=1 FL=1